MVEKTQSREDKVALLAIATMLSNASNGARSPLLDVLHARLPKSGGDGAHRANNGLAITLVTLRIIWGDSKTKAIDYVHEISGISRSHLKRAFHGASRANIQSAPVWAAYKQVIAQAIFLNPQLEEESSKEWQGRIERWLVDGMSLLSNPSHDHASILHELF